MPQDQPEDYTLLVDILTSCFNLERITISMESDPPPRILEAFRTPLQSLRLLLVYGWSEEASALLLGICAPLRVISLQSEPGDWVGKVPWSPVPLERVLSHLSPTLEELELDEFTVDPARMQPRPAPPITGLVQYPAVHSLTVGCIVGRPLLDRLHHLFPALCGTLAFRALNGSALDLRDYTSTRAANKLAQEDDWARSHRLAPTWKKLDRLVCDPVTFYLLALRCPIRLVMVRYVSADTRGYVMEALRENPVPRLKLSLLLKYGLGILDGLLPPELAGTLTHLTIVLEYANDILPASHAGPNTLARIRWADLLDRTISILKPLHRLTHLRLAVQSDVCDGLAHWPAERSEAFVRAVRADAFDFAGAGSALVSALPSLQYLFLATDGTVSGQVVLLDDSAEDVHEEWHASRGWRVADSQSESMSGADAALTVQDCQRVLVELEDTVMETIVWREERFVSEAEAESLRGNR
ncbi:hypothetical protein GSI_09818 [Ganoderma sinense ZZ0214-1]|uniref:Uncharacterized protein n=1 Tax=Ganoderma sinense ZZ0214-1 TaxID=1077348 RepID=A0A2G8S2R7_9APHY|nr:hypothetical protein GSI_09818 [Ganoderma sinense ZZ0214-1]